jgi:hypothetical protein
LALTPTENEAFLREVDDNLRRDQMTGLARKWGKVAAIAVGIFLLGLGAFLWWQSHRAEQAGQEGEKLTQLLQNVQSGSARSNDPVLAELTKSPRDGYRAMARLTQADLTARTDPAAAATQYQAIANDDGLPQPVRDLALLRAVTLQFDSIPPAEVVARLKPIAVANNPWFGSAGELTAMAYLKMNRKDLAGPLFAAVARDSDAPAGLRDRASSMATALGQTVTVSTPAGALKE